MIQKSVQTSRATSKKQFYICFFLQSTFTDLLKDSNKEIDWYEEMFSHIQSFDIVLKAFGFWVSLI